MRCRHVPGGFEIFGAIQSRPELAQTLLAYGRFRRGDNEQEDRALIERTLRLHRRPDLFENVRCMVSPMVVSMAAIYDAASELQGVQQYKELIDLELMKMGAFVAAEMTPHLSDPSVKMPVFMMQVLDDAWMRNPEDAQKTFDLLGNTEKELFWIEGTTRRFKDGYNEFGRRPEKILASLTNT